MTTPKRAAPYAFQKAEPSGRYGLEVRKRFWGLRPAQRILHYQGYYDLPRLRFFVRALARGMAEKASHLALHRAGLVYQTKMPPSLAGRSPKKLAKDPAFKEALLDLILAFDAFCDKRLGPDKADEAERARADSKPFFAKGRAAWVELAKAEATPWDPAFNSKTLQNLSALTKAYGAAHGEPVSPRALPPHQEVCKKLIALGFSKQAPDSAKILALFPRGEAAAPTLAPLTAIELEAFRQNWAKLIVARFIAKSDPRCARHADNYVKTFPIPLPAAPWMNA